MVTYACDELVLLLIVSARVWQHLVAFSSVVNRQDVFNRGSFIRPAAAAPGLDRAAAVAGFNGLKHLY